jgi:ribosomal protein S27AE
MLLAVLTGLLISTFVLLFKISHDGIAIRLTGRVEVTNATTGVTGEVSLVMPNPVSLIATGPRQEPIPANLSLIPCPKCGGTMLPVRFNLWTGAIEWRCLTCGYTSQETEGGHP